jgi:phenylacetate-CoA ligase
MMNEIMRYIHLTKSKYLMKRNLRLDRSDLEKIQQKKIRALIEHSYHNVPFYKRLFDSVGIKPNDIKTTEDLSKIPIITKFQVQHAGSDIIARNIDLGKCIQHATSGSTGLPLKIIMSGKESSIDSATYSRIFEENGVRSWSDTLYNLTGPHNIPDVKNRLSYLLHDLAFKSLGTPKYVYASVFYNINDQISILKKTNPTVISGYPKSIRLLAMAVLDKNIKIHPRLIFTSSELLDAESREIITSAFGVNPIDFYANVENGVVAWECGEHAGYHLNIDTVAMEIIKNNENIAVGEKGEVILTNLYNYTMPFIRYKIGDIATACEEQCPCGIRLPLIKDICGRSDDFAVLPDGRIISPRFLSALMKPFWPVLLNWNIIQEKEDKFTIVLVRANDFSDDVLSQIETKFKHALGLDIQINFNIVDEIKKPKSGKIRSVISKVDAF